MISDTINIANKLEVMSGNLISIPGCEPVTGFTATSLAVNMDCNASTITLRDALMAIPDATLEAFSNPRKLFFVLPAGPPTRPGCNICMSIDDFYQLLRDAAPSKPPTTAAAKPGECDTFPIGLC
jgi:hypothetical protein